MSDALWLYGQGKMHNQRWAEEVDHLYDKPQATERRDAASILEEMKTRGLEVVDD